jgi:hypothetical protein
MDYIMCYDHSLDRNNILKFCLLLHYHISYDIYFKIFFIVSTI